MGQIELTPVMPDLPHHTQSLAWQTRQGLQNLGEWFEYQFSRVDIDGPEIPRWRMSTFRNRYNRLF